MAMAEFERNSEIIVGISYRRAVHYMVYVLKEYNLTDDTLQGIQQHCLNTFPEESDLDTFIENMCTTIRNEHSSFFESVITTLNVDERTAKTVFMEISRRIYENGINWGRILTLYAFAGTFAVYFASKGSMELVEQIPNWIAEIFDSYLAIWMVQNGGWNSLKTHNEFDNCSNRKSPRPAALIGFGVGVAAVAAAGLLLLR